MQNLETVQDAVCGCDAVVGTLGGKTTFLKTSLEASAARVNLHAMQAMDVRHPVAISVLGPETADVRHRPCMSASLLPTFLRSTLPGKNAMEAEVMDSDVDWVLVRPPVLPDELRQGRQGIRFL